MLHEQALTLRGPAAKARSISPDNWKNELGSEVTIVQTDALLSANIRKRIVCFVPWKLQSAGLGPSGL